MTLAFFNDAHVNIYISFIKIGILTYGDILCQEIVVAMTPAERLLSLNALARSFVFMPQSLARLLTNVIVGLSLLTLSCLGFQSTRSAMTSSLLLKQCPANLKRLCLSRRIFLAVSSKALR